MFNATRETKCTDWVSFTTSSQQPQKIHNSVSFFSWLFCFRSSSTVKLHFMYFILFSFQFYLFLHCRSLMLFILYSTQCIKLKLDKDTKKKQYVNSTTIMVQSLCNALFKRSRNRQPHNTKKRKSSGITFVNLTFLQIFFFLKNNYNNKISELDYFCAPSKNGMNFAKI